MLDHHEDALDTDTDLVLASLPIPGTDPGDWTCIAGHIAVAYPDLRFDIPFQRGSGPYLAEVSGTRADVAEYAALVETLVAQALSARQQWWSQFPAREVLTAAEHAATLGMFAAAFAMACLHRLDPRRPELPMTTLPHIRGGLEGRNAGAYAGRRADMTTTARAAN